ncbi:MAG: M28 family peptidase [candidate division Zixibacteria bacterium]|nr:M28 family peptidase [candidate division Zixibacteria bacterium]
MSKRLLTAVLLLLILAVSASAGDLYKVLVKSEREAGILTATGAEPVLVISDGYLVIADPASVSKLTDSGLEIEFLAHDISRNQLAVDNRLDRGNVGKFPILYEEGNLRMFKADLAELSRAGQSPELAPILTGKIDIEYSEPMALTFAPRAESIGLDSLIGLVEQDSLLAFTTRLQAFYRRYAGTDSNYASRDWIAQKFQSFNYDSIEIDSFTATVGGLPAACQNVVAVKTGSLYPELQIIVGAHRDAVSASPGADDNGSGTAAVLEVARILRDINTDITFVFILFDAEEQGLVGAYHYVNEAKARSDSIIYMFNMDMIAHFANSTQAKLYHGTDQTYSLLWQHLADSLVGISGFLSGNSSGSDHFPFTQSGYRATFASEYIFSTVYHSPSDSTKYMNFEYMTGMVQASLATVYRVNTTYLPTGTLLFSYPVGLPSALPPEATTLLDISLAGTYGEIPASGTGLLHYSVNGGEYQTAPLTELSPGNYQATFPAAGCYSKVEYYFSIQNGSGETFSDPRETIFPYSALVATESNIVFADNFETDKGWTVGGNATAGLWNRGYPLGGGDRGDPPADFDGSGQCALTDNRDGDTDVDNGVTTYASPTFDLSNGYGRIHYARWFSNNTGSTPNTDWMYVWISNNNGSNWTMVETVGPVYQANGGWYERSFWVGDYLTPSSQMKMRFDASDQGSASCVEAGLDDFQVTAYYCVTFTCGDLNDDGLINILDITALINFLYRGGTPPDPTTSADVNGDGIVNIKDITHLINFLYKGGSAPACP